MTFIDVAPYCVPVREYVRKKKGEDEVYSSAFDLSRMSGAVVV